MLVVLGKESADIYSDETQFNITTKLSYGKDS